MKQTRPSPRPESRSRQSRRGFTTPAVAIAMFVVMCGLALILDRLWLDAADLELTTAAEAAALVAASELASDDLLKPTADPEQRFEIARVSAGWIASQNVVAGSPVLLDTSAQGDIRLGRLVVDQESGKVQFEETSISPTTAVVTAMRTRRSNNPVSLFVAGATGQPFGDVVSRVEASIDNRVCGVRPQDGTPVPAFPIAIWWKDPAGLRADTWQTQIEARKGPDQYGYDTVGQRVYSGSDGIPEIVLSCQAQGGQTTNSNVLVVDLGAGLNDQTLGQQFTSGLTAQDLSAFGGELCLTAATPQAMRASAELRHADREAMEALIGEPRICMLYTSATPIENGKLVLATCSSLVAIRVLAVQDQPDGSCTIVAQPCVLKTKTAILDVATPYSTESVVPVSPYTGAVNAAVGSTSGTAASAGVVTTTPGNPYIYKLQLSH